MSVELRPLGVKCNIQCQYCYQNPQRDAGNVPHAFDLEAMKAAIEQEGGPFTLFGGEPLLVPEDVLENLWSWGFEKFRGNGIQTNGTLINQRHIRLFKKYKVHVGLSVDGPDDLNDVRWVKDVDQTREATARTHAAIERLCREQVPISLIVTLHRGNATADKLPLMLDWFRYLDGIGLASARLHVLEVEDETVREKYALTTRENLEAFLSFHALEAELRTLKLDLFNDMRRLLRGDDNSTTCVWNACDPYTTRAVRGVEGHGQRSNCGRTNKDGIDFVKADVEGFERYLALYHTPQEVGGCKGCRFFLMCKGQCPGTAIDGDWRNRTEHCDLWKGLYRHLEEEMLDRGETPVSARPDRGEIEQAFLDTWMTGRNTSIANVLSQRSQGNGTAGRTASNGHGDHTDTVHPHVTGSAGAGHG
jgi:uncharacterized protein